MISGFVNSDLEGILKLRVRGDEDANHEIDAVIDTGFNGFLTLPPDLIEELNLTWLSRQQGELADGSLHVFDVYEATVIWNEAPRAVEVEAADTEPLLGMSLLENYELRIAVVSGGAVTIAALPK